MGLGKMTISDEVFVELAKTAMQKVENVVTDNQTKDTFGKVVKNALQKFIPDIHVETNDKNSKDKPEVEEQMVPVVSLELKLTLVYGVRIPDVVAQVRETVKEEIESITGYKVEKIDISVEKLVKPEKLVTAVHEE